MAFITVSNTFADSTNCDATKVNQNFTNIVDGLKDGSKNIQVDNVEADGTIQCLNGSDISGAVALSSTLQVENAVTQTGTLTVSASILAKVLTVTPEDKTLSGGSMTPSNGHVEITGEGDVADDLDTVQPTNFNDGDLLILRLKTGKGYAITIKNNTGNILCGSDRTLNDTDTALMQYDAVQSKWCLLAYSDN